MRRHVSIGRFAKVLHPPAPRLEMEVTPVSPRLSRRERWLVFAAMIGVLACALAIMTATKAMDERRLRQLAERACVEGRW